MDFHRALRPEPKRPPNPEPKVSVQRGAQRGPNPKPTRESKPVPKVDSKAPAGAGSAHQSGSQSGFLKCFFEVGLPKRKRPLLSAARGGTGAFVEQPGKNA